MRFKVQITFISLTLNNCISLQVEPLIFKTAITSTFSFRRQTNVCFQSYSQRAAVFQRDLKQADRHKDCTQQSSLINNKKIPLCRCSLTHWGKLVCEKDVKQQWNETNPLLPPPTTLMRHVGSKLRLWVILCSPSHITKSRLHHSSKLYQAHSSVASSISPTLKFD